MSRMVSPSQTSYVFWEPSFRIKVIFSSSPGFGFFKWPWFKNEDVEKGRNLVVVVVRVSRDGEVRKRCAAMFDILAACPARVTIFSIGGGLSIDTRSAYFV
ncbi:hypothetical protein WN66_06279 [Saccharomyces cerevisiae]|nr:hypothetical protein WN66_06279 [Saccharomyces cerevisiae]